MDEQGTGPGPGEAAAADASRIAARLIREEFGEPTSTLDETAPVPVTTAAGQTGQPIHEEFAAPARPSGARSHRTGMLAGLGIVGALLAVLVLLSPGSGQPRLPVQSVQDVSPLAASGPKTAGATASPTTVPSTTATTPSTSTPTTQPHRSETVSTTVTYANVAATRAPAPPPPPPPLPPPTSAPAAPPTTAPPPTTNTTAPPTTTTTTTAKHCILGLLC
jgi:hypothetical protein